MLPDINVQVKFYYIWQLSKHPSNRMFKPLSQGKSKAMKSPQIYTQSSGRGDLSTSYPKMQEEQVGKPDIEW